MDERLTELWNAGTPIMQMAAKLGLTRDQIRRRRRILGLAPRIVYHHGRAVSADGARSRAWFRKSRGVAPKEQPKMRRCLCCSRDFMSAHCGNRMCGTCLGSEVTRGIAAVVLVHSSGRRHGGAS